MGKPQKLLAKPVRSFIITKAEAEGLGPLGEFSCGDHTTEPDPEIAHAIEEVNTIAQRLFNGEAVEQSVVLLEQHAGSDYGEGELVGFCGVRQLPLFAGMQGVPEGLPPGGYINVLGTHRDYRSFKTKKKGTTPGSRLLSDGLMQLKAEFGGGPAPYVWAAVRLGNQPSVDAFRKHRFRRPPPQYPRGIMFRQGETGGLQILLN